MSVAARDVQPDINDDREELEFWERKQEEYVADDQSIETTERLSER